MATLRQHAKKLLRRYVKIGTTSDRALDTLTTEVAETEKRDWSRYRSYSEIPGPKPIALLGNTWRFLPFIGAAYIFTFIN